MKEYLYFYIYFLLCLFISIFIYKIASNLILKKKDIEKMSTYECGFFPFEDARNTFNVKFYLISILFIIFDLEIVYLFPWALILIKLNFFGIIIMIFFLIVLTIGFIYEWSKKALDWE